MSRLSPAILVATLAGLLQFAARDAKCAEPPRPVVYIGAVRDTGQFLPDSVVLARVGPRTITVKDFVQRYFAAYVRDRPEGDSLGRVQFLENYVNKEVLGLLALSINKPLGFEDRGALRANRQRLLSNLVYKRYVSDSVQVSEAEIRRAFEQLGYEQRFRHIVFEDLVVAKKVRGDILQGRIAWSQAFQKYSVVKLGAKADGELGWVSRDKLPPLIALAVYSLKIGEVSQPVSDLEGHHLFQSLERRPSGFRPDFSAYRRVLLEQIRATKEGERAETIQSALRKRAEMAYDTAACAWLAPHFRNQSKLETQHGGPSLNISADVPEFTPSDTARVLARWKTGRITVGEFVKAYSDIQPLMRPPLGTTVAIFSQIDALALAPDMAELGSSLGLEKDKDYIASMDEMRERLLVERMYQDSVASRAFVDSKGRRAYYEAHLPQLQTEPAVRYARIIRRSKASAESLAAALRQGARAEAVLRADSLAGQRTGSIEIRYANQKELEFQKVLFELLRPGQSSVHGPDDAGQYLVLQVVEAVPPRTFTYAEAEQWVDESARNEREEQLIAGVLERAKRKVKIESHPELVMRIRLVDPELD